MPMARSYRWLARSSVLRLGGESSKAKSGLVVCPNYYTRQVLTLRLLRKRRCGWLDLFLVKYSHEMNDYTSLMLTKLDILDDFSEIKVATSYSFQGKKLESFPAALDILENVEVHYETLPGWSKPTTGISTYDELPENAKKYVEYIEKFVGVPIK